MKAYNINENAVQWIMAFLTNRQQKVKVNCTLSEWNRLSDEIMSAPSVNTVNNRLDIFWEEQEVFYNYKANITGNKGINV